MTNGNDFVELEECIRNPGFTEHGAEESRDSTEKNRGTTEENQESTEETRDSTATSVDPTGGGQQDACTEYTQIKPYAGMPKEVLLLYSSQARYRVPRQILFWLLILCVLALVALTITVIALSPPCLGWWRASPLYQIYPRSFRDSDGDGVGDLKGIIEQLSHFEYLNIKSVWISPFYRSPMRDFGYDVEDFREVDPVFGTMQDFEELLAQMHNRGLKLIMDFIPNHTSDRHRWFNLSRSRDEHYKDYYLWTDCNATAPRPNNWVSVFGNSSWTYDEVRGQCYLHQFLKEQPDLNFRNPHVRREMIDILRFWLEKGVDGFRMAAVKRLLEASHLRSEPLTDPSKPPEAFPSQWELHHDYTTSQLGLHQLLQEWRAEMDVYSREPGRYRFMVTESYDHEEVDKTMMYYGSQLVKESDFPFNFYLLDLPRNPSGLWVQHLVLLWMSNMPAGRWPNWVLGNHDNGRIASSAGRGYTRVINMLMLTLPGTPTTYYGEEIGMENINIPHSQIQDPAGKYNPSAGRDPQRSPMQWTGDMNAGFSNVTNATWLPVHPDYSSVNVETQKADSGSVLAQYRLLSRLRQSELPLQRGWFCPVHADTNVFSFLRELDGLDRAFLVLLNFGKEATVTDLSAVAELPDWLTVVMSTAPGAGGRRLPKASLPSEAGEGLVLQYSSGRRYHARPDARCFVSEKACYLGVVNLLYKC
ncbi:neutral and basic amino acid transport protein rBAT [Gadus macrocephalus]|uniref:neutral and basic amino acid transport protein rBAT n=1 Tax=Gadus macrocephalus TaxID=80720 RepID=UPI0028CB61C9|nr:neutral and basic amino acid transport protein rBAT [Gadus macrocephalus]